jgi:hypothetical protein
MIYKNKINTRIILSLLALLGYLVSANGQSKLLSPVNFHPDPEMIQNESYGMKWYAEKDSRKMELGKVFTNIALIGNTLRVITKVALNQSPSVWVDTTIVKAKDFQPIYHASYNDQRDMVLAYDEQINGYYWDKQSGTKTLISEKASGPFYDSSFYSHLLRWLPLEEGYSISFPIFNVDPNAQTGRMTVKIKSTSASSIEFNGRTIKVWVVTSSDTITDHTVELTSYIEQGTRRLLKESIRVGQRKMTFERIENP